MQVKIISAAALAVVLALPAHGAGLSIAGGIGRVKSVTGTAMVYRAGQKLPVYPGLVLEKGDSLATSKGGRVGITFSDNSRFAAGPNSRISITDYSFDDTSHVGTFTAVVTKGAVAIVSGYIAKSAVDAMKVRTPGALLGVRGTYFVVDVK